MSNMLITLDIISKAFLWRLRDEWPQMAKNAAAEMAVPALKTRPRGLATYAFPFLVRDMTLPIVEFEELRLVPAAKDIARQLLAAGASQTCLLETPESVVLHAWSVVDGTAVRVLKVYNVETDEDEVRIDVGYA